MIVSRLKPFLPQPLDVLFIALNPPERSNSNGHYFSSENSAFFKLLAASGLITRKIEKAEADDVVFGSTDINYAKSTFGVIDLVDDLVETKSARVRVSAGHVHRLKERVLELHPRFACVIHSKVRSGLNRYGGLSHPLTYGWCGAILPNCDTEFLLNYFPNGNRITPESFAFGITEPMLEDGKIRVYSAAKTVADCFKLKGRVGTDLAIQALREAVRQRKATMDDLWKAAKVCRVANVMRPYMESLS